jgi:predicted dehydrogenase
MKCLFVGFGTIAQKHYNALNYLIPDCQFFALRSGTVAKFEKPNIINIYSWDDLPDHIDFAIISTPTHLHVDSLNKLVDLGVSLFIEKPVADKLDGLNELIQKINYKKIKTYVACNLRFLPVLNYFINIILPTISKINEVTIYCGSHLPSWRPNEDFKTFYSAHEEKGGGVHLDLFHELDYACWLFGMPNRTHRVLTNNSNLNITAKDFANYILMYNNFSIILTLNYYRKDAKRFMEVLTENETYYVDLLNNKIIDSDNNILFHDTETNIIDTYKSQMIYFLEYINNKKSDFNTIENSTKILNICLSNETKR